MLTSLSWLSPGSIFPPPVEQERISKYQHNERLFLTEHSSALESTFAALQQHLGATKKRRHLTAIFNYQQLLSKKIADFVCGEDPLVSYGDEDADGLVSDELMALIDEQDVWSKVYEAFIDVSRYGNGALKVVDDRLSVVNPQNWFPICSPTDIKHVTHMVLAYPVMPDDSAQSEQTQTYKELYVEIHSLDTGAIEIKRFNYGYDKNGKNFRIGTEIKAKLKKGETYEPPQNPLGVPLVYTLTNTTHSGSIYGIDDYSIINGIIEELIWRVNSAGRIMDKHSDPSLSGPRSALQYDQVHKMYYVQLGNYFQRETEQSPDVRYLTWDGNLDANWKEIETLLEQLYILSEMGAAFLEGSDKGSTSSGTALRLRLVSPRIKAQRLAEKNTSAVKKAIVALAAANGLNIDIKKLSVRWNDGLPDDPVEDAQRVNIETGGKQVKSIHTAIKERGYTEDEAELEYERIREEQSSAVPAIFTAQPTDTKEPDEDDTTKKPPNDGEGDGE